MVGISRCRCRGTHRASSRENLVSNLVHLVSRLAFASSRFRWLICFSISNSSGDSGGFPLIRVQLSPTAGGSERRRLSLCRSSGQRPKQSALRNGAHRVDQPIAGCRPDVADHSVQDIGRSVIRLGGVCILSWLACNWASACRRNGSK